MMSDIFLKQRRPYMAVTHALASRELEGKKWQTSARVMAHKAGLKGKSAVSGSFRVGLRIPVV